MILRVNPNELNSNKLISLIKKSEHIKKNIYNYNEDLLIENIINSILLSDIIILDESNEYNALIAIKHMQWDTNHFNKSIASISGYIITEDYKDAVELMLNTNEICKKENIELIYSKIPAHLNVSTSVFQRGEFELMDSLITNKISLSDYNKVKNNNNEKVIIRNAVESDIPSLREIAAESFRHDRFHMDKKLNFEKSDELYSNWIENSFNNNRKIFVAIVGDEVAGFNTCKPDNNTSSLLNNKTALIDLIAVSSKFRGMGIGKRLVEESIHYYKENGYTDFTVGTQIINYPAIKLYHSQGFKVHSFTHSFHKWINK